MVIDLIEDLVAPLAAILLHFLTVFDSLGPIGGHFVAPLGSGFGTIRAGIRARLSTLGARTRGLAAILDSPGRRPVVLQERGCRATGGPGPNGRSHAGGT
jgi:hypothetical protein